jgi:hypothetical protein
MMPGLKFAQSRLAAHPFGPGDAVKSRKLLLPALIAAALAAPAVLAQTQNAQQAVKKTQEAEQQAEAA